MKTIFKVFKWAGIIALILFIIYLYLDKNLRDKEEAELSHEINPRINLHVDTVFYGDSVYVVSKKY